MEEKVFFLIIYVIVNLIFAFTFKNLAIDNGHSYEANYCFWISFIFPLAGYNYVAGLPKLSKEEIDEDKIFKTIVDRGENLYQKESPVVILRCKLVKNTFTEKYLLKMKFINICEKTISKVICSVNCVEDKNYDSLGEIECIYANLVSKENDIFGEDIKHIIRYEKEFKEINYFTVKVKEVVFEDGSSWESDKNFVSISDL